MFWATDAFAALAFSLVVHITLYTGPRDVTGPPRGKSVLITVTSPRGGAVVVEEYK